MVNMIFSVRQVQEKYIEQKLDMFSVFIDLMKAFDTVNREALWSILAWYSCLQKFIWIIRLCHFSMTGQVLSNDDQSDPFKISNGSPHSKTVSWHQLSSTYSSPVPLSTLYRVLLMECISTTIWWLLIQPSLTDSQVKDWLILSRQQCLLMTVHSWHTSPVTCKPCWTGS